MPALGALFFGKPGRSSAVALPAALFLFLAALAPAQAAEGPVALDTDARLVGWWKFDETSGTNATDSSKHGRHGLLEGGLSFETHSAPGRGGKALRFEGKKDGSDGVRIPGFKGVTGPAPRTVTAWIKTRATSGDLVTWGKNDAGQMWILGHIRGRIGVTPKGGYLYMKAATNDDAWHHVAVVVRAGSPPNLHDDVHLFRDGEPAEIDDIGLLDLWPIETGADLEVRIGRRFQGLLDDVRIYDRALSEEEVRSLFKLDNSRSLTPTR